MSERTIDWANINWDTVNLVELRAASNEGLDPEWVAKYGDNAFDAALVVLGVLKSNESVDSVQPASASLAGPDLTAHD